MLEIKQDDSLTGTTASTDVATEKNLENLVKIGQELLNKPASRVDPETGHLKAIPHLGTNADALRRLVHKFYNIANINCTLLVITTR